MAARLPALILNGVTVHDKDEMLSLTDLWRAAGSVDTKRPADWLALASAIEFRTAVEATLNAGISGIDTVRGGTAPGTWGHWQIALAYAKYLDPQFHMQCNAVIRERMQAPRPAPVEIPAFAFTDSAAREARLLHKHALSIGRLAGLKGNQLLIAANRVTKRGTGFDMLGLMGLGHLIAPVNDPLVVPTKLGQDLGGVHAIQVNRMLLAIGLQVRERDHKGRPFWKPSPRGEEIGARMVDVERDNDTGAAQQLKWPLGATLELLRAAQRAEGAADAHESAL
ncbi:KilA-N domain-containing protein [Methylobacterium sp. NEAU 140]|uniref:KilA-N domain-containing protein n=1 Tax=Methylobacterium sp. NEAU 140 TaxID=3064945 RepID=UPI002732BCFE|nr:KilA-N domain-containing protein [Methylobacterium sp. NEAU 140]MDP4024435.1 KilA-N domain-containing protein [Methylobacterium sp. NEAU 140]